MVQQASAPRRRTGRSPAYPGVNLETAVQRARRLYQRERQHATPVETIAQHWGYKSFNGPGSVTLSALKKFGLLTDEGSGADRKAKLTDLAVDIIENPSEAVRKRAMKEAALLPTMHQELWDKYGASLPSDPNLRWELTRDRGFTETGADEFIPEYRETVEFAGLTASDVSAPANKATSEEALRQDESAPVGVPAERDAGDGGELQHALGFEAGRVHDRTATSYLIPLPKGGGVVQLSAKFPLTESEWEYFMTLLTAMKAGLVDGDV